MIWMRSATLRITAPDSDGDRRWEVWVEVENKGATYEKSELSLVMREAAGAALGTEDSSGDPVPPGVHLLRFGLWPDIRRRPHQAECTLEVRRVRGLEPVRVELARAPAEEPARPATPIRLVDPDEEVSEEVAAPPPEEAAAPPEPVPASEPPKVAAPPDPWKLLDGGDRAGALAAFDGYALDSEGRDRVRRMMRSVAAEDLVLGCDIGRLTVWRSLTTDIRRLVSHGSSEVRRAAAEALGVLGGPALVPLLRPLLNDRDGAVRDAALAAIERLEGQSAR